MSTIGRLFAARAAKTPQGVAVVFNGERVTYAGLEARANAVAHALRARRIGHEHVVAIAMRHSPQLVAVLLGIAKVGAAYLGVELTWPPARAHEVLQDAGPSVLVIDGEDAERWTRFDGEILAVPRDLPRESGPVDEAWDAAGPDSLSAVVYTSGTTGRPKGVLVTVRSVVNRLEWMWNTYPFRAGDVAFLFRPYTTVGFSWDCFGPLLQGVPTIISPVGDVRDVIGIVSAASAAGATHVTASPGFWEAAVDLSERGRLSWPSLRLARTSGEPLPPLLVERWRRAFPPATLLNIYGATECSGSTAYDTSHFDPAAARGVPVGTPIPGVEVLVVDAAMSPVADGEEGEICVAGASLARGYLGAPALTADRFVPHVRGSAERMFRTGDWGVRRPDGQVEITGRRDFQVKVRGYRVGIQEVEAALARVPGVREAAIHARRDGGSSRLVAFLVAAAGPLSASDVREALAAALPGYMIPAAFVAVPELPRTVSGKIDRQALETWHGEDLDAGGTRTAPRTPSEVAVAAVWAEVLGMSDVGVEDDFFEVGGHSLSAVAIVTRLQEAFGIELPVRVLFDHPFVGELAAEIDRLREEAGGGTPAAASATIARV